MLRQPQSTDDWQVQEPDDAKRNHWIVICKYCYNLHSRSARQIEQGVRLCPCRKERSNAITLTIGDETLTLTAWAQRYPDKVNANSARSRYYQREQNDIQYSDAEVLFGKKYAKVVEEEMGFEGKVCDLVSSAGAELYKHIMSDLSKSLNARIVAALAPVKNSINVDMLTPSCTVAGLYYAMDSQGGLTIQDCLQAEMPFTEIVTLLQEEEFDSVQEKVDKLRLLIPLPPSPYYLPDVDKKLRLEPWEIALLLSPVTLDFFPFYRARIEEAA